MGLEVPVAGAIAAFAFFLGPGGPDARRVRRSLPSGEARQGLRRALTASDSGTAPNASAPRIRSSGFPSSSSRSSGRTSYKAFSNSRLI